MYIHVDGMPKRVSGIERNHMAYAAHAHPAASPINAAQGKSLIGFRNSASPVAIRRYLVPVSSSGFDHATAAVVKRRIPMMKPRYDVGFSLFFISHEAAVMPPRIRMYGA